VIALIGHTRGLDLWGNLGHGKETPVLNIDLVNVLNIIPSSKYNIDRAIPLHSADEEIYEVSRHSQLILLFKSVRQPICS